MIKRRARVSGKEQGRQEPVQAKPIQERSPETPATGGVVQEAPEVSKANDADTERNSKISEVIAEINASSAGMYSADMYQRRAILGELLMPDLRQQDRDELATLYLMKLEGTVSKEEYDRYIIDRIASNAVSGTTQEEMAEAQKTMDEYYSKLLSDKPKSPEKSTGRVKIYIGNLISHYKAIGLGRQEAWRQYVADTILQPWITTDTIDAGAFSFYDNTKYPTESDKYKKPSSTKQEAPEVKAKYILPIMRGLAGLQESAISPAFGRVIKDVRESLDAGRELSAAMARHPTVFSQFYLSMVRVGEMTGRLDEVFLRLFDHLEFDRDMRARA